MSAMMQRTGMIALALLAIGCGASGTTPGASAGGASTLVPHPDFPTRPAHRAGRAFTSAWSDGKAELSGYRAIVPRYGHLREAELVLVYVTEPMNRHTWIKDDDARGADRVDALKLNVSLKFLTGIYPYSVMTSVFTPVDDWGGERFSPVKISMTAQEWCGHVFAGVWPGRDRFESQVVSYFASEGEAHDRVTVPEGTLYEDALLIQLRELDGPFAGGRDWRGSIVPTLWGVRRAHEPMRAVPATITRSEANDGDTPVTRFVLSREGFRRTYDVERAAPRRVIAWQSSDGEDVHILRTARLPYWQLNDPGNETYRDQLGLPTPPTSPPPAEFRGHLP